MAEELVDRLQPRQDAAGYAVRLTGLQDGLSSGATAGGTITKQYGWSKWREQIVRGMYSAARAALWQTGSPSPTARPIPYLIHASERTRSPLDRPRPTHEHHD